MKKRTYLFLLVLFILGCTAVFSACEEEIVETFTVSYFAESGGMIVGEQEQTVKSGESAQTVAAVPLEGCYFIRWSDGYEVAERTDDNITENVSYTAIFSWITFTIDYVAGENGVIEGDQEQTVIYNGLGNSVRAVPDEGFYFDHWSDGSKEAERTEKNVKSNIWQKAYFKETKKTFTFNYGLAIEKWSVDSVELTLQILKSYVFPVPEQEREHFTFEGWFLGEMQVSDELGVPLIGMEIFDSEGTELTAKWQADENFTFKMLLVYVTEVKGSFKTLGESEIMQVDYQMSELDREICHLITKQVKKTLDEMMEGMVTFEVDEYFTNEPLTQDNFYFTSDGWFPDVYGAGKGKGIAEVREQMPYYQGILVTFCLNDWERKLTSAAGITQQLTRGGVTLSIDSGIVFESVLGSLILNGESVENLFDENYWRWGNVVSTYVHELCHIIEFRTKAYGFHKTMDVYHENKIFDEKILCKHYLLGIALVNGEYVGIPYEFWGEDEKKYKTEA